VLDLLVIGAGPAGCAAAICARRAGLDVLILDAAEKPRPVPGETLHPGIEPIFQSLGISEAVLRAGFHRHRGVWVEWDGPRRFEAYGEDAAGAWCGFQADRQRLQAILLDALAGLGVAPERPCTPDALIAEGGSVCGAIIAGREVRARWIADATGRRAWLARQLGLVEERCSSPLRARYGWFNGDDGDGQPCLAATKPGWEWRAPLGNGQTARVSLTVEADGRTREGVDVSWRIHRASAGPGYFLLGDAAATLDPSSSHGVLRALMSGILCAHRVAAHRRQGACEIEVARNFESWTSGQFDHDVAALRALYARHPADGVARLFSAAAPQPA
jgi:2-polyprenyl-6-methoxyphenol hydroxylase-like FAD-dependent oxidoreductase